MLAYDRGSTLWDAARLLSVGEEGYAYRRIVGARVRALPEFKEIATFFTSELVAQLADARSTTTAKLDAPVNKLARLLNSASIKRILLNDSLTVDFDRLIAGCEVLVVKGALGVMGAGNTSVMMQLLVGMLDAALARQQDLLEPSQRVAVALKVDEAPLVLNRGFAETMALKRSAGLETVACWQTDAQWIDREVRDQLDALFAHRVYFATASTRDARAAVGLTMSEFSDTVRPGIEHLSALGRPDARLHLPRHHAIVSWSTREGRQPAFLARTLPLRVDRERLALHAALQRQRGGRPRTDLRQPHWQRLEQSAGSPGDRRSAQPVGLGSTQPTSPPPFDPSQPTDPPPSTHPIRELPDVAPLEAMPPMGGTPCESFRELIELDLAHSVRWPKPLGSQRALDPDAADLEMLGLIASGGHVLSSQLHRQLNPKGAATTTQRRLKRLWDAGLVERFQFHRRDGGGVPMCYLLSAEGWRTVRSLRRTAWSAPAADAPGVREGDSLVRPRRGPADPRQLRRARFDVHVAGWSLALLQIERDSRDRLLAASESVLEPPTGQTSGARRPPGPADLRLAAGRVPHDFLRTNSDGERVEIERFETVRPSCIVQLSRPALDVLVEFDDRLSKGTGIAKLERYDHFLTGWSAQMRRYGERREAIPLVVFVCRDRARARRCAQLADQALRACRAYPGEYPFDWDYLGRSRTLFVAERDAHEGLLCGYGVSRLPPEVRVAAAGGDPAAAEPTVELRAIRA